MSNIFNKIATAALAAALACALAGCGQAASPSSAASSGASASAASSSATSSASAQSGAEMLDLWNDCEAKTALVDYVEAATDEASPDFIPEASRIATFDFDGTLFCETDPKYFDYTILVYRVTQDPGYKDRASEFERAVAAKIVDQVENGTKYDELSIEHGQAVASAFKGMTPAELYGYVQKFMQTDMPSYTGMKRGEGFYRPMVEVVDYLKANGFDVYIVSGADRLITRGIFSSDMCPIKLPLSHVIGSDESLVATGEGDTPGLDYTYKPSDELVTGGDLTIKNVKMNKVSAIQREIGEQPVLSFGNSSGDFSMHNYALDGNKHKALAFQLCCDDTERERGDAKRAASMRSGCEKNGYVPISMRDDWTTIYGDGVTYSGK